MKGIIYMTTHAFDGPASETSAARVVTDPDTGGGEEIVVDCRSEVGITIGLLDTIMVAASVLHGRDLRDPQVQEALKDLRQSPELRRILAVAAGLDATTLNRVYKVKELERAMHPRV
jgi:hypothetical protein